MTFASIFKQAFIDRHDRRRVWIQCLLCLPGLPIILAVLAMLIFGLCILLFAPIKQEATTFSDPEGLASCLLSFWAIGAFVVSIFASDEWCRRHGNLSAILRGGLYLAYAVALRTLFFFWEYLNGIAPMLTRDPDLLLYVYLVVSMGLLFAVMLWNDIRIGRARPHKDKSAESPFRRMRA